MLITRALAATALTSVTLAVTACGGGGGDTLSKSELNTKATAICKDVATKAKNLKEPTNAAALGDYFAQVAPITQELATRLKALKPADDVKNDWNALTSSLQKSSDAFKQVAEKAKAKDQAGIATAGTELGKLSDQADAAAKKIGLTDCGKN